MKSGFKRAINWNWYQTKVTIERQNQYLDYLIDPSFLGVNRLFVLIFENNADRTGLTGYFFPKVEIKDYNVIIDGQNIFDHPGKNDLRTDDKIQKIKTGQGDDYTTGCLLEFFFFFSKNTTRW